MSRRRRFGPRLFLLAALAPACGGADDGAGAHDGGSDLGVVAETGAPADAAGEAAAIGPPAPALPAPVPPRRLFGPEVVLNGDGSSSCSTVGIPGQLWCSFSLPGAGAGVFDLWVLDVVAAQAGPVPCDGSHPACRKLMEKIWTGMPLGGPSHPFAHAFENDTLMIYGAAPPNDKALHQGPIYAWRPTFKAARRLSTDRGLLCRGSRVAYCLDDVIGSPQNPDNVELRAGPVLDLDAGPLPVVTRFRPYRTDGVPDWRAEFSPDGAAFFFSSPDPDPTVPVLRWIWTSDIGTGTLQEVVRDVGPWRMGSDGRFLYFMNRLPPAGTSTLSRLALPGHILQPGAPEPIAEAVHGFDLVPPDGPLDRGVTLDRDGPAGRGFDLLFNFNVPPAPQRLFSYAQPPESVQVATDLGHTVWISFDFVGEIIHNPDLARCALATTATSEVFSAGFVGADLVHWSEGAGQDQERNDGFVAPRDNCHAAKRYVTGLHHVQKASAAGLVFTDNFDDASETVSLKFARAVAAAGATPAHLGRAVLVAERVNQYVNVVGNDDATYLLFRATAASAPLAPGVYLFGPVRFDQAPSE